MEQTINESEIKRAELLFLEDLIDQANKDLTNAHTFLESSWAKQIIDTYKSAVDKYVSWDHEFAPLWSYT